MFRGTSLPRAIRDATGHTPYCTKTRKTNPPPSPLCITMPRGGTCRGRRSRALWPPGGGSRRLHLHTRATLRTLDSGLAGLGGVGHRHAFALERPACVCRVRPRATRVRLVASPVLLLLCARCGACFHLLSYFVLCVALAVRCSALASASPRLHGPAAGCETSIQHETQRQGAKKKGDGGIRCTISTNTNTRYIQVLRNRGLSTVERSFGRP